MLSIVVICKNEENRIKACLESAKWADEIIILDDGSEDGTVSVAKKYTDKIFTIELIDFDAMRNFGMEKAKGDWVLFIDADERITDDLKKEIEVMITLSDFSAYAISRRNIIFGKEVRYKAFWPDWVIRLLKKSDFEHWWGAIHEQPKFKGNLGYSTNSLIHLTHRGLDQVVLKSLEWSKIDAKLRLQAGHPKMSGWRFLRIFLGEVYNQGIKRRGFFNGTIGIMDSLLQSFSLYMSYVRLWEMQQGKSLDKIYDDLDEELIRNSFKYQ